MSAVPFLAPFNAKAMSYEEIAKTFVASRKFSELAGQWNSLLIGPRGSGKTTLLKMLSPNALRAWSAPEAAEYKANINYTGIYVPADIAWGGMISSLGDGNLDSTCFEVVAEAAFATNVFLATINTMQGRIMKQPGQSQHYRSATIPAEKIEELVVSISLLWKLEPRSVSLRGISLALSERLLQLKQQARLVGSLPNPSMKDVNEHIPYVGLPVLDATARALSVFDELAGEEDGIWALLLDEFEVAPACLQKLALASIRAGSQKLLLKVALAPCGPHTFIKLDTDTPPDNSNDFRITELWYSEKKQADDFCNRVFAARVATKNFLQGRRPEDVLGESIFGIVDEEEDAQKELKFDESAEDASDQTAASKKAKIWRSMFEELAEKDVSFKEYLARKGIDPAALDPRPSAKNGNTIRKIAPVVAFRNAYRSKSAEGQKRGGKAYNSAYYGWLAISAMSEGNPRWLMGIMTRVTSDLTPSSQLPVPASYQQEQVMSMAHGFAEMLKTAATKQFEVLQTTQPIFALIKKIGLYFHRQIVLEPFGEDPHMSFTVDRDISPDIENCLRIALNHGALVCYDPPDSVGGYTSLRGKRLRIAYLLAPVFQLPLRKSKAIGLSRIMKGGESPTNLMPTTSSLLARDQGELF